MERCWKEAQAIASYAKLDLHSLSEPIQSIFLSPIQETEIKLIELNDKILSDLEEGKSLVIRGLPEDEVLICSETECYDAKDVDTSNTLLLLQNLTLPDAPECKPMTDAPSLKEILCVGKLHSYLELRCSKPKLQRVQKYLSACLYSGKENESAAKGQKYTLNDLLNVIPATECQILEELKRLQACLIQGYWRLLDPDYKFRVLSHILKYVEENSWGDGNINKDDTVSTLSELEPYNVLEQIFDHYMVRVPTSESGNSYGYNANQIARFYAEILLRPGGRFNLTEFLQIWKESLPEGVNVRMEDLEGLAISDTDCNTPTIWYFPEEDLPDSPQDRIASLFMQRKVWNLQEITPYLRSVCTGQLNVVGLLTKYCRSYVQNGVRMFTSKYPKS